MYKFVDTTAGSGTKSTLLSLNTVFNGVNLDEALTDTDGSFTTLTVSGRGILSRRIRMTETPRRHGVREKGYTYDAREITVKYKLTDRTNEGFRDRFNRLNGLLLGSKKKLEFTDEDAYFLATLQSGDTPEEDSNNIVGTLLFICTDPAKNMNKQTLNIGTDFSSYVVGGHDSTPWKSYTKFSVPQEKFVIETNKGGKIILNYDFIAGDELTIDAEKRDVFLNGKDLATAVDIKSEWNKGELPIGEVRIKASQPTGLYYHERYY